MNSTLRAAYRAEGIPIPRGHPEQDLHKAVAGHLDWALPAPFWYTTIGHGGGGEGRGRTLKKEGMKPGIWDLLFRGPDRFTGWIELKAGKNGLSDEQEALGELFRSFGDLTAPPCYSLDDVKAALTSWGIVLLTEKPATERIRRGLAQPQDWPESNQIGRKRRVKA